jgi:phosphoadenosine phosphosulfate reductase
MAGIKPFEGALDYVFWCDACNVPLIRETCGICEATARQVRLSPPGDVRFCSPYERTIIRNLFEHDFGCDPIGERLVLLNKIPGDDKADEVIVDGYTIAVVYYDLKDEGYRLDLRPYGAKLLLSLTDKKTVTVDVPRNMHLSGKGIKGSTVIEASADIKKDDIVLIRVNENFTGLGVAKTDAVNLKDPSQNTIKIRKIGGGHVRLNDKLSTIEDAVAANRKTIKGMEKEAINVIKGVVSQGKNRELPVTVSFSGGKDSLVVLDLTKKAVKKFEAFYIDTGLEFPETTRFVEETAKEVPVKIEKAGKAFDENFPAFGPPAKDFRWCCKVCKLGPVTTLLSQYKQGVITIDGKRRYESFQRGGIETVERNPFVPGQMSVFPIKDWRAIEVWLYIHMEKLPYNPLYDRGFERIGCWLCPAALQAEYVRMKELHPDRYGEWQNKLHKWADESGLTPDYVRYGFWRWKSHPNKMLNIAHEKHIPLKPSYKSGMALDIIRGVSPCTVGGYSIEGVLRLPNKASTERLLEMLKTIGAPAYSEDLDVILVRAPKGKTAKLFAGGQIYASASDREGAGKLFEDTVKQVLRASLCTKCRICIKACPKHAIRLEGHIKVDERRCDHCGRCTKGCVVARYYDRLVDKKIPQAMKSAGRDKRYR